MIDLNTQKIINNAVQLQQQGDLKQAENIYRSLIQKKVAAPVIFTQLALICSVTGREDEAKNLAAFALKINPAFTDGFIILGDLFRIERNFPRAIDFYQRSLKQNPRMSYVYLNISFSLLQLGDFEKAKQACQAGLSVEPNNINGLKLLAQICNAMHDLVKAEKLYEQVLAITPDDIESKYAIANLYKSSGDLDKAKTIYLEILNINPGFANAHFSYSSLHKYKSVNDFQFKQMLQQIETGKCSEDERILLSFALAKAYEDIAEYKQAFKYLKQGNDLRFSRFNYAFESDQLFIQSIINGFTKVNIDRLAANQYHQGNSSKKPIFIVGMPRSGTSLAEKILATHSDVHGAGELETFFKLGTSLFIDESTHFLYQNINEYDVGKFKEVANAYLLHLSKLDENAKFVTDKLPFNQLLIGLIKVVFPNAKIIHCKRDAIDNCLSIYKKNFSTDNYRFAYNLITLGQFYNLSETLMSHWYNLYPDSIYTLNYEDLVASPDEEIRKLISACGLEWQDACLDFHKSKAIVTTASAYQVRQPMYKSSVELWKSYQDDLTPLIEQLTT